MPVMPDREVARILAVVAHPDDVEFWLGGTVAGWAERGIEVSYCVLTDGEGGGFDPTVPRQEIPGIRRAEQRRAAEMLGVKSVRFLGLPEEGLRGLRRELILGRRLVRGSDFDKATRDQPLQPRKLFACGLRK